MIYFVNSDEHFWLLLSKKAHLKDLSAENGHIIRELWGSDVRPPHSLRSGGPARDKYFKLKKSLNLKNRSFENVSFSH